MTRTRRIRMNANVTIPFVTFERDARFKPRSRCSSTWALWTKTSTRDGARGVVER